MKRLVPWAPVVVLSAVVIWVLAQLIPRERDTERTSGSERKGTWWEPASLRDDKGPAEQPLERRSDIALAFERGVGARQHPEQRQAVVAELAKYARESSLAYDALLKLYALWSAKADTAAERRAILTVFSEIEDSEKAQRLMLDAITHEDVSSTGTSLVAFVGSTMPRLWSKPTDAAEAIRLFEGTHNPRIRHALMIATMSARKPLGELDVQALRGPMRRAYYESQDFVFRMNVLTNAHRLGDPNLAFELAVDALGRLDIEDGGDAIASAAVSSLVAISSSSPDSPHRAHSIEFIMEVGARPDIGIATFRRCVDALRSLAPRRLRELRQRVSLQQRTARNYIDKIITALPGGD